MSSFQRIAAAFAAVAAVVAPAYGASPKVGEQAPDFGSANWVLNEPLVTDMSALVGDVVFVEKWGVKCGPCLALIPHVQKLHAEYADKGLHIFAFEAQNHTPEEARATASARGCKTYPVSAGGGGAYQTDGGIPFGWIIGVDGKVKWSGNPGDPACDRILKEELAKVKFPGLGLADLDKDLAPAAKAWVKGDLGGAREAAEKLLAKGGLEGAAKAQAEQVVARASARATALAARATKLEGERRYSDAIAVHERIAGSYKGAAEGDAAADRLKEMRKDKDISRELNAAAALEQLLGSLKGKAADVRKAQLEGFAKSSRFEGTLAAEQAAAAAEAAK